MNALHSVSLAEEEILVAELALLGIHYLSRQTAYQAQTARPPDVLLVDLVQQPSARVRSTVIAVLLSHPEYADAVPAALRRLQPPERLSLQSFYLAARLLQQEYAHRLRPCQASRWRWLPDLQEASAGLCLPEQGTPRERLNALGSEYGRLTQTMVNWIGTYEQAARQLLRQWEGERHWNRSL